MKRFMLCACLMLAAIFSGKAQNHITDSGFEKSMRLDSSGSWYSASQATPDLISEDNRFFGSANAFKGLRSAGIILYDDDNPEYREYLSCKLNRPLLRDTCYLLTIWVQATAGSYYLTDGFGIWLGNEMMRSNQTSSLPLIPVWKQPRAEEITSGAEWTHLKITFRASGGEQYLILGNFSKDSQTMLRVNNRNSAFRLAYLQMDEISLAPCYASPSGPQNALLQTHSKKGNLFIPNVLTPNEDGFNDEFYIPGLPPYSGIVITDHKNREVFRDKAYRNNWNGAGCLGGKYHYELLLPDGNRIYGSFDLVRKVSQPVKSPTRKKRKR
jgi:hypothetical protein